MDRDDFIRANTALAAPPLVPELRLWLASEITPIWEATEAMLAQSGVAPPFWAFPWVGGQAVARHILDHPALVAGRRVLDFAAGSGLGAIAAARAGAAVVAANEIDPVAAAAIAMNAAANGFGWRQLGEGAPTTQEILIDIHDRVGLTDLPYDVVIAGDVCYEQPMAARVAAWLTALAEAGVVVLMGDPGRNYLPASGLQALAAYDVPTTREIEDREVRRTVVYRVTG
ncbi:MAG: methyltransferase [Rhodospirillales bacterium]